MESWSAGCSLIAEGGGLWPSGERTGSLLWQYVGLGVPGWVLGVYAPGHGEAAVRAGVAWGLGVHTVWRQH